MSSDELNAAVDALWVNEIVWRAREVADGTVEAVDWEVARERIARRLRERRGENPTPPPRLRNGRGP